MLSLRETPDGVVFKLFVLPRSSKNMISGIYEDAIKLKLTAPPVDGSANKLCIKFLSKYFGISKSRLEIVAGHTSRSKQILVRPEKEKTTPNEINNIKELIISMIK